MWQPHQGVSFTRLGSFVTEQKKQVIVKAVTNALSDFKDVLQFSGFTSLWAKIERFAWEFSPGTLPKKKKPCTHDWQLPFMMGFEASAKIKLNFICTRIYWISSLSKNILKRWHIIQLDILKHLNLAWF